MGMDVGAAIGRPQTNNPNLAADPFSWTSCLFPWEALDALSEKENSITGGSVDYKQMDISNVMILPDLLKIAEEN